MFWFLLCGVFSSKRAWCLFCGSRWCWWSWRILWLWWVGGREEIGVGRIYEMKITLTSEVEEHFAIFPDQKRILDEIVEKVPFYFPDANLQCEFVGDDLCVNILTTKSVDEASKALDRFDNEWWLDKWANSPICVCLDFVCVWRLNGFD